MPLATSLFLELDENELEVAEQMHRRQISDEQLRKFEGYVGEMFTAFGLDLDTPATRDTPRRFVRALLDVTEGYDGDPKLLKVFPTECRGEPDCRLSQVIEGPIHFFSLCEHHALPFFSQAYVGYIAHERIIGISKLTRRGTCVFVKRFTVQERIGQQIADASVPTPQLYGVAVYIEAHHLCVEMRDVREISPMTRNGVLAGRDDSNPALRSEFFVACRLER